MMTVPRYIYTNCQAFTRARDQGVDVLAEDGDQLVDEERTDRGQQGVTGQVDQELVVVEDEGYEVADFPGCYREQEGEGEQDAADAEVEEKR